MGLQLHGLVKVLNATHQKNTKTRLRPSPALGQSHCINLITSMSRSASVCTACIMAASPLGNSDIKMAAVTAMAWVTLCDKKIKTQTGSRYPMSCEPAASSVPADAVKTRKQLPQSPSCEHPASPCHLLQGATATQTEFHFRRKSAECQKNLQIARSSFF